MELVLILLLVLMNGVFAMSEIAVVSARKARLQQLANEGDAKARAALALANEPNQFLSTVQVGITLVGVLAGAFGGATIAESLARQLQRIPWLAPYSQPISFGLVVLLVTYLSLVLGELVPKRLALHNPERIAAQVAAPMQALSAIAFPLVRLLTLSTEGVLRLLGAKPSSEPPVTEEEIEVLLEQGTEAGVIQEAAEDLVKSVFRLSERSVCALMTPRLDITWLDLNDEPQVLRDKILASSYSRFPVAQGSLDNAIGIVQAKDLLSCCLQGQAIDLSTALCPPLFVPENLTALQLLDLFKESRAELALVIDEFGSTSGLVTLKDVLEAIVGDMPSVDDPDEPQLTQREDSSWLVDGLLPLDKFYEHFEIQHSTREDTGGFQTLGGFVMKHIDRIPAAGDSFEWHGLCFEVMDMDGRRVDKVLVSRLPAVEAEPILA